MRQLEWSALVHALPFLWQGLQTSFVLVALAMAGGIALGTMIAVVRLSAPRPVAVLAAGYVNGLRSIPLIMVIFWFYLLVPLFIGRPVGAFTSALIAFTLFEAAYYSEIMRAGIGGISGGQMAAALAVGMSRMQAYRYVILPQALRRMAPVLLTQSIALFQDSSLVYVIGLHDFMTSVGIVANREARLVEFYLFAALVYFAICHAASRLVKRLSRRMATA
ncbi:amino acid ABC transporter permease [Bradyrhizobium diazoefficiens]|nr:amino acid ABC transporter permease [Bradyrhizobium diazoefficiens]UCF53602.1 MAG: amino acid ABC transporter permease [Bradyrhizobium sp.]MBR0963715.1 amino acid ABC transporter permease [Bradyrhizobium diazoefficiens]MBR0977867.1 amino acid ABC transporter permease [Bradyrhizobium diazoefficiens]MBR1007377.1 amino acid ABC transporter permease [Bradyrhizobium diazoefficiens]MBR1012782.1 amino acid ABC transporter permease [Bradyrhizobium diazoefficiens]